MYYPHDVNPHFGTTQQQDQYPHSPHTTDTSSFVPLPHRPHDHDQLTLDHGQHSGQHPLSPEWTEQRQPILHEPASNAPRVKHQGRQSRPVGSSESYPHRDQLQDRHPRPKKQSRKSQPHPVVPLVPTPHHDQGQHHSAPKYQGRDSPLPLVPSAAPIAHHAPDHHTPQHHTPHRSHEQPHGSQGLHMPRPQRTNFCTWSTAACCAIFWVLVILSGLIVLILYLVLRPHTPKFEISTATLNAAYLDMGYLLNADLTVLLNFTNSNKKSSIYFSPMYLDAYYGGTLIATTKIEPFTARKLHTMFANVHMVASQVPLGLLDVQRLQTQLESSTASFEIKGYFRSRANFGSLIQYSYKLHGDCTLVFSTPPNGVMVGRKCRSRH